MSQIVILNAGGQYCHLIARRIRELGVHAIVADIASTPESLAGARGIIISGGPASVNEPTSPSVPLGLYKLNVPVLGICYGHQLIARDLGGLVARGHSKEYGRSSFERIGESALFENIAAKNLTVWMSHGDTVVSIPTGFEIVGRTDECKAAAIEHAERRIFGLQFHPEVAHTDHGTEILRRFVFDIAGCVKDWDPRSQLRQLMEQIRTTVGQRNVFFLVSGGVDSTVAFFLCYRALGPSRVRGLYVDTGFMRDGDTESIEKLFASVEGDVIHVTDRSTDFFHALEGVTNPERKRAVIGDLFLKVQEEEFAKLSLAEDEWLLGQGTIYPDTIESGGARHSSRIKTHHNRVPKIQALIDRGKVIEPLTEFYKDEVRLLGEELGLSDEVVHKHPFPGPGLAVRCLCSDQGASLSVVPREFGIPKDLKASVLPIKTVGVQGDERSYAHLLVLEGTADLELAGQLARDITNRHRHINRVALALYTKPVAGLSDLSIHVASLSRERVDLLRRADAIVTGIIRDAGFYSKIWQLPVGLLPLGRSHRDETIILRPVHSRDGMTADFVKLPWRITERLCSALRELQGVDAILYDVTNKPPATIELE